MYQILGLGLFQEKRHRGVERKSIKIRWVEGVSWNINVLYGGILPIIIVLVGVNNKF